MFSRCRDCGTPLYARSFRTWNADGTITARFTQDIRICQVDTEAITAVIDGLSERIGYPVDLIAIQGQRKAMRKLTEDSFALGHGALGFLSRRKLVARLIAKLALGVAWTVGHALPEALEYVPATRFKVKMRSPYCWQLMVGDVWGGFEALHNVTAEVHYTVEGESITIDIRTIGKGMVWGDLSRLELRHEVGVPHSKRYERCGRCGVPLEVSRNTEWDLERGMVFNRVTGRREATILVEPLTALLREVESELGDAIPKIVQELLTEHTAGSISPRAAEVMRSQGYRSSLDFLRPSGMGYPASVEMRQDTLTVRIDNPYSGMLLAGMIGGLYKAIEEIEPSVWWVQDPKGYMIVEVSPA